MQVAASPTRVAPAGARAPTRVARPRAAPHARRLGSVQGRNLGLRCSATGPAAGAISFPASGPAKMPSLNSALDAWRLLKGHAECTSEIPHLRELMADAKRCEKMFAGHDGITLDYSRQRVTARTMQLLFRLAEETKVAEKIEAMFAGQHLNTTEDRAVLHVALRSAKTDTFYDEGRNVVPDVHAVLDKIRIFSEAVRSGTYTGSTGKPLTEVVCIGIGGSFLGPAFVHTALETDPKAQVSAAGRTLSFLANVDPEDVSRALKGKNPETTLVIVVSKTFTTAETMLNARTVREWIIESLGPEAVSKHMVAVSTNLDAVAKFGLDPNNSFGFWDWVGGRYSVTSAVGILPLAMQYGYPQMERFLAGARSMDRHFASAPLKDNLPVLMGLLGVWNTTFLGCASSAVLPYCQALSKLAPHIQQVSMESNGKGVALDGTPLDFEAGEIIFGEPGTNGQHSFYQLIHQGRIVPAEFVGAALGQQAVYLDGEVVSNHDELMSNFFAQADALAYGKTAAELTAEGVPPALVPHKTFSGNRPSLSLLLPSIGAYQVGQILSLYENKIAAQGFVWGINSFDQWGVELGKVLAGKVRTTLSSVRKDKKPMEQVLPAAGFNYSTTRMLTEYLGHIQTQREGIAYSDVFKSPFDGFCSNAESCAVYQDD